MNWLNFSTVLTAIATLGLAGFAILAAKIANSQLRQSANAARDSAELQALFYFDRQWEAFRDTRRKASGLFLNRAQYAEDDRTDLLDFFEAASLLHQSKDYL